MGPAAHVEGLWGCLDYYQSVGDAFSRKLPAQYDQLYPGPAKFTGGSACGNGSFEVVTSLGAIDPNEASLAEP
jgi:hypothetical protein